MANQAWLPRLAPMSATPSASRAAAADPVAGAAEAPVDIVVPTRTPVEIIDIPTARVHHPSDLLGAILSVLAIVLVMALATYAHNTTTGVAEDVQGFAACSTGSCSSRASVSRCS